MIEKIQNYIIELYNLQTQKGEPNAEAKKMFNSVNNWEKSLKPYTEDEVIGAIDFYHKYKSNKTAPTIRHLLNLLEKKDDKIEITAGIEKPICKILEWQEDYDNIIQRACIGGIIYNPYWSKKVDSQHKEYLKNNCLDVYKNKLKWQEVLIKAKKENKYQFEEIEKYNDLILDYTLAHRLGYL